MSRRALLATTAGGLFLAPFMRARRLEAQSATPKRLILVFTPDSHPPEWWPTKGADARSFTLNEPLAGFKGLEPQLLFPRRVDRSWTFDNHHEAGIAQLFTGQRFFDDATRYANGPSIDQVLLQSSEIRGGTPIASVHLCAAGRGGSDKRNVISYSGPGRPITQQPDPVRAFEDIFKNVVFDTGSGPSEPAPRMPPPKPERPSPSRSSSSIPTSFARFRPSWGRPRRRSSRLTSPRSSSCKIAFPAPAAAGRSSWGLCEETDTAGVDRDDRNADAIDRWGRFRPT